MTYSNPLHPGVPIYAHSSFTSLSAPPLSNFSKSNRQRLPQPVFMSRNKWQASMSKNHTKPPIYFDFKGNCQQGIPMNELCMRGHDDMADMMAGGHDLVFAKIPIPRITLHIIVRAFFYSIVPFSYLSVVAWV